MDDLNLLAADVILALHALFVAFVVGGLALLASALVSGERISLPLRQLPLQVTECILVPHQACDEILEFVLHIRFQ